MMILLSSNWLNLLTLTYNTQLDSMGSSSCNIRHLAQQEGQQRIQWSMLGNRTISHLLPGNGSNSLRVPHHDITGESRLDCVGGRKCPSVGNIVQRTRQKDVCRAETMGNGVCMQRKDGKMRRGLCGPSDLCWNPASSSHRDSDDSTAGTYGKCWNRMIDNHIPWNHFSTDLEWYQGQSEQSGMFRRWRQLGWHGCWWKGYRAWDAERIWRTRLGDRHNLHHPKALHGQHSAEAPEARRNDKTGMGGRGELLQWGRYTIRDDWIGRSSCWEASIRHECTHSSTYQMWNTDYGSSLMHGICNAWPARNLLVMGLRHNVSLKLGDSIVSLYQQQNSQADYQLLSQFSSKYFTRHL